MYQDDWEKETDELITANIFGKLRNDITDK
jgi:hypothetical protein